MPFVSKNEIENFSFEDCQVTDFEKSDNDIVMLLEALIVKERNTQNANFTQSYADVTKLILKDAKICSVTLAGYKVYDANDNLLEEIEDRDIPEADWAGILKDLKNTYLYRCIQDTDYKEGYCYDFEFEHFSDAQNIDLKEDTFVITIKFSESVFSWDRYLNRVQ